jgi:hypothetical protein
MSLTRATIDAAIADRIAADPSFRAELQNDPRAALSSMTGMAIPEGVRITIHEESPADIHLVIASSQSLADSDLEMVAGAGDWSPQHLLCSA